ncbi:MAG: quinone-dependent dihydroorotate dehydrogenase [Pontimonas sp.]
MYRAVFPLLKLLDPEVAHYAGMGVLRAIQQPFVRDLFHAITKPHASLKTTVMGIEFPSPFGLAAGFDKNAEVVTALLALGFGHVEVGTVTPRPQPGNPKPRLFRLPSDRALVNRMGFNNDGIDEVVNRLMLLRRLTPGLIIGVNIGKNRDTSAADAVHDYAVTARLAAPVADYLVVNVSSPNTPGLRALQDPSELLPIIDAVKAEAGRVPVLVKISPDSPDAEIRDVAALAREAGLAGVVATNTTVSREGLTSSAPEVAHAGQGGLSGAPLATRSLSVLEVVREALGDDLAVISVGGVSTGSDVHERLRAGASLVQAYTSFVYRGPLLAHHVNRELQALRA